MTLMVSGNYSAALIDHGRVQVWCLNNTTAHISFIHSSVYYIILLSVISHQKKKKKSNGVGKGDVVNGKKIAKYNSENLNPDVKRVIMLLTEIEK